MDNTKDFYRQKMRGIRDNMPEADVASFSALISELLISTGEYKKSGLVMSYMDIRNEVRTGYILKRCLKDGKRIAVPMVEPAKGKRLMTACEISDPDSELRPSIYGIRQPDPVRARRISPEDIELVLVPGLAFDRQGNRIGYGAGYYDEFLSGAGNGCIKIGLAYDFQVVEELPRREQDVRMDVIITEKGLLRMLTA